MLFLISSLLFLNVYAETLSQPSAYDQFINSERLQLTRNDHVLAEHMVSMMKFTEKGYVSKEIHTKILKEAEKAPHFALFLPWLRAVGEISRLSTSSELMNYCRQYVTAKETLPLEKILERRAGNYCREKSLEAIGRDITKTNNLSDESTQFIQENLKYFLTKKNRKNFAFFLQSQVSRQDILKKISQEVTVYSVRHEIVPSHDVLKDIMINEQITKLIQDKGFNPLQHQNVFYAEFGKLIEMGYRALDKNPEDNKVKEHYQFLKNYLELNQDHLPVGLCLTRLNDFAKAVFRAGFKDLSRDIFKYIVKKNHKEIHEDALFFYLWSYIYLNDFSGALKLADSYQLLNSGTKILDPRLKFWIGYTYQELSKVSDAIKFYENVISDHPLSYYSIMSTKKLNILKPDSVAVKYYTEHATKHENDLTLTVKDLDDDHASSLVRLKAWSKIDDAKFMRLELKRLNLHSSPLLVVKHSTDKQLGLKSDLHIINSRLIQDSGNYLATFKYLYAVLEKKEVIFNRTLLEILYPKPFLEDLIKLLKNDSLDPLIVLSLIRQESVFNPLAKSPVGARGLMQLMPKTAQRYKRSVRDRHLVNPAINIDLGTKYFKNLLKRYDGNLVYVLSAYNAGESRVERWRNLYFNMDESIIKNIEAIPFLETRNYVKLIFRNIFFYKLLLENEKVADTTDANKIFNVNLGFKR